METTNPVPWGMSVALLLAAVACGEDSATGAAGGAGGGTASSTPAGAGGGGGDGGSGGAVPVPTRRGQVFVARGRIGAVDDGNVGAYVGAEFYAEPLPSTAPDQLCELVTLDGCQVQECLRAVEEGEQEPDEEEPLDSSPFVSAGDLAVEGLGAVVSVPAGEKHDYWLDVDPTAIVSGAPLRIVAAGDVVPGFELEIPVPAFLTFTSPQLDDDLVIERDRDLTLTWDHQDGGGLVRAYVEASEPVGDHERIVTVACDAEVTDGALTLPSAALDALPAVTDAYLFTWSREEAEVVAGDWRVTANVLDYTMLYGTVEVR
jgi:hypothetical protein